ncbi:S-adenosyl-L-methionine-dependent methyltransferases superfamily protein [Salvia divinorum]|uniref:S-adenosyl-L-methionine-dependent methyltransferases superfamily protein n=1 Tax=Salvia divinorum TaxID=28513 RepID=A0ABD1FN45_SALDI
MAYQSRPRKRVRANPIRRAPDGSAFLKCEGCGISVAVALADMHECGIKKNTTQCRDGSVERQMPRSAFHFFMDEFLKTCEEGTLIEKDKKGCDAWKNMSIKERQPYVDQAVKLDIAYSRLLQEEETRIQPVDDEADSADVGKYDKRYEDSMMNYYDSENSDWLQFLNIWQWHPGS